MSASLNPLLYNQILDAACQSSYMLKPSVVDGRSMAGDGWQDSVCNKFRGNHRLKLNAVPMTANAVCGSLLHFRKLRYATAHTLYNVHAETLQVSFRVPLGVTPHIEY
jgi:hypothetical protein